MIIFAPMYTPRIVRNISLFLALVGGSIVPASAVDLSELFLAIEQGDYQKVTKRVENQPEIIDAQDDEGNTLFIKAAQEGQLGICKWLIEKGADKELADQNGSTPLMWALDKRHLVLATNFVEWGADVNKKNRWNHTPLYYLLWHNFGAFSFLNSELKTKLLKKILKEVKDLDVPCDEEGTPLLLFATSCVYDAKVTEALLKAGANPKIKGVNGETALHKVMSQETVKKLIKAGADVNAKNNEGETPLHVAVSRDFPLLFGQLIQAKDIDVNVADEQGNTPLHTLALSFIITKESLKNFSSALLEKGADYKRENNAGHTFLEQPFINTERKQILKNVLDTFIAKKNAERPPEPEDPTQDPEIKAILSTGNVDTNPKNDQGENLLHVAASKGYLKYCRTLVANPNITPGTDKEGKNPLHVVTHPKIAKLLLDKYSSLKLDAKDNFGRTYMHYVEREDMVDFWAKKNPDNVKDDVNAEDNEGNTPLHLFALRDADKNPEMYKNTLLALLEKGADPEKANKKNNTFLQQDGVSSSKRMKLQVILNQHLAGRGRNNQNNDNNPNDINDFVNDFFTPRPEHRGNRGNNEDQHEGRLRVENRGEHSWEGGHPMDKDERSGSFIIVPILLIVALTGVIRVSLFIASQAAQQEANRRLETDHYATSEHLNRERPWHNRNRRIPVR